MMPDEKYFIDRMKVLQVKMSDHVICYDTADMQWWGYRAAWMFQAMGHPKVSVLDGGYKKWVYEKLPIATKDSGAVVEDFNYSI